MKIALIQMKVYPGEKDRNIRHAFELLEEAAPRSDIVILPELWSIGYDFHDLKKKAIRVGDSLCRNLSELAGNTETVIFAGTLPVAENKKIRNTTLIFDNRGHMAASYSKRHLFYGYLESKLMVPGDKLLKFSFDGIRIGAAVCYEFYFPKMWRKMAKSGVTLVAAPSSWPAMHIRQWDILTRARAVENGICIAAVNMAGAYRGMAMGGHSRFVDPLGNIMAEAGEEETILYAEYDQEKYKELGRQLAVIRLDKQRCFKE